MNQPTPDVAPFRYYVQMVLPAVYGDELSYYEVLAKVTEKLNEVIENLNKQGQNVNDCLLYTSRTGRWRRIRSNGAAGRSCARTA